MYGKKLNLSRIKEIEIGLLKHLSEYCDDNNIRYFLSNGTLLGAIKYQGFIPWDDDIDVLIPREDYNRLLRDYRDGRFQLLSNERNHNYLYPFAKFCDPDTLLIESGVENGVELGVNIDVIPLDLLSGDYKKAVSLVKHNHFLAQMLLLRKKSLKVVFFDKEVSKSKKMKLIAAFFVSKAFSSQAYINKINANAQKYKSDSTSVYVGAMVWPVYGKREVLSSELFNSSCDMVFEGQVFSAPIGYDAYLRSLYGDYKQDPPLEKQKTHHNFTAYLKNSEND